MLILPQRPVALTRSCQQRHLELVRLLVPRLKLEQALRGRKTLLIHGLVERVLDKAHQAAHRQQMQTVALADHPILKGRGVRHIEARQKIATVERERLAQG